MTAEPFEISCELVERVLGELPIGGDLAAEYRKERRRARSGIDVEHVIARHRRGICGIVVVKRPDSREGVADVGARQLPSRVAVDRQQEIVDLLIIDRDIINASFIGRISGSDEAEVALVGIDEDHSFVRMLKKVGVRSAPEFGNDDVASLDESHAPRELTPLTR